jgi:hypothetical protein
MVILTALLRLSKPLTLLRVSCNVRHGFTALCFCYSVPRLSGQSAISTMLHHAQNTQKRDIRDPTLVSKLSGGAGGAPGPGK